MTSDIANSKFNYGTNKNDWVEARKNCMNKAKKAVGVHPRTEMDGITNIDILTRMKNFLENELRNSAA